MSAANRVVKNTIFLYMKMFITVFVSLYTTRLVLKALGVNDFGIFNLIIGLLAMLNFFNAAFTMSSQRYMSYAKGKDDFSEEVTVFNISVMLHLSVAVLLAILFFIIGPYIVENVLTIEPNRVEAAKLIFNYMVLGMFFTILSVPYDAIINAHEHMLFVAVLGVVESFLKLGAAFAILDYGGDRLELYGLVMAMITVILFLSKMVYSHKRYISAVINFKKYFDKKLFHSMVSFGGYSFLGISTHMIAIYGQGVVLNMFFGTVVNAAQGIVNQVSGQLNAFANTMLRALNPMITKSEGSGNRALMLDASFAGSKLSFFLLIVFYVPVMLEMETIFNIWLVEVPEYTLIFCELLLIRNLIEQLYVTLSTAIISVGNIKQFQIFNAVLNLLPLPVSYVLFKYGLPPYSIYIVFIVYSVVQGGIYIYFAKKECDMSVRAYFRDVVLKSVVPFALVLSAAAVPHMMMENGVYRLLVVLLVTLSTYAGAIWMLGLNQTERTYVVTLIEKVKSKF